MNGSRLITQERLFDLERCSPPRLIMFEYLCEPTGEPLVESTIRGRETLVC